MCHEVIEPVLPYHKILHEFELPKDFKHQKMFRDSILYHFFITIDLFQYL